MSPRCRNKNRTKAARSKPHHLHPTVEFSVCFFLVATFFSPRNNARCWRSRSRRLPGTHPLRGSAAGRAGLGGGRTGCRRANTGRENQTSKAREGCERAPRFLPAASHRSRGGAGPGRFQGGRSPAPAEGPAPAPLPVPYLAASLPSRAVPPAAGEARVVF